MKCPTFRPDPQFAEKSAKIGNQVHLRSLRDAFATIMPLFILAGIGTLVNNVFFVWIWGPEGLAPNADLLTTLQYWGNAISNGTLNISALLLAGMIGYSLAKNKRFDNAISCVVIAIAAFVIMMPLNVTANLAATSKLLTDKVTTADVPGRSSPRTPARRACSARSSSACSPPRCS